MRHTPFAVILGLISFIFAINSFFLDAASTAQSLAWFYKWLRTLSIDQSISDFSTQLRLLFYPYRFYFLVAIIAFVAACRD